MQKAQAISLKAVIMTSRDCVRISSALKEGKETLSISQITSEFSAIVSESEQEKFVERNGRVIFFHGNEYSFEESHCNKHKSEFRSNVTFASNLLRRIGVVQRNGTPLRHHSDVAFLPVALTESSTAYIHPWLSVSKSYFNEKIHTLPKTKEFVTAGCLFGGAITGIDAQGNRYPLIDHHLQVIDPMIKIIVDESIHPYEMLNFGVLEGLFRLMPQMNTSPEFVVRYHLPVVDYLLYGVQLFVTGKMTLGALEEFISQVNLRGKKHRDIIERLAAQTQIKIRIESPFDALFPHRTKISATSIFRQLSLTAEQILRLKSECP
jgi:hypothetical protein